MKELNYSETEDFFGEIEDFGELEAAYVAHGCGCGCNGPGAGAGG